MHPHSGALPTLPSTPCVCSLANLAVSKELTADTITARLITANSALASKGTLAVTGRTALRDVIIGSSTRRAQLNATAAVNIIGPTTVTGGLLPDVITARLITATQALASKNTLAVTGRTTLGDVIIGSSTRRAQLNATAAVNIAGPTTVTGGLLPDVITARLITATQALASKNTLAVSKLSNLAGGVSAGATTLSSLIVSGARQLYVLLDARCCTLRMAD